MKSEKKGADANRDKGVYTDWSTGTTFQKTLLSQGVSKKKSKRIATHILLVKPCSLANRRARAGTYKI
jgi:hypothetical protein